MLFAFDEWWANRAWNDLEFFDSMDSKESASAHGQSESNLGLPMSAHVRPPDMPESDWKRRGMQQLGPQRWRNQVQDVDIHDCDSLLQSRVQVPLTAACEDVAADDQLSETDVEEQSAEYHEYHTSVHSLGAKNRRRWWPLCTASRLRHRTIWEQLYDEQGNPRIAFPASLQRHRERLFEIL